MPQNSVDTEGFHSPTLSCVRKTKAVMDPELGLKQRPLRNSACWVLPLTCSAGFLVQCRTICLEMTLPTVHRACFCHRTSHACWIRHLATSDCVWNRAKGSQGLRNKRLTKRLCPEFFQKTTSSFIQHRLTIYRDILMLALHSHCRAPAVLVDHCVVQHWITAHWQPLFQRGTSFLFL